MSQRKNIVVVGEDGLTIQGLNAQLLQQTDYQVKGSFEGFSCLHDICALLPAHLIIILLSHSLRHGLQLIHGLKLLAPGMPILVMSSITDEATIAAICLQTHAYLHTSQSKLLPQAIQSLLRHNWLGNEWTRLALEHLANNSAILPLTTDERQAALSPVQQKVLKKIAGSNGEPYKLIAASIPMSLYTFRSHLKAVHSTLDIHSKAELMLYLKATFVE